MQAEGTDHAAFVKSTRRFQRHQVHKNVDLRNYRYAESIYLCIFHEPQDLDSDVPGSSRPRPRDSEVANE